MSYVHFSKDTGRWRSGVTACLAAAFRGHGASRGPFWRQQSVPGGCAPAAAPRVASAWYR